MKIQMQTNSNQHRRPNDVYHPGPRRQSPRLHQGQAQCPLQAVMVAERVPRGQPPRGKEEMRNLHTSYGEERQSLLKEKSDLEEKLTQ